MTAAASAFWDFSLRLYAQPGIPPACLALQDDGGADVNVALFLLYLAAQGRQLDSSSVASIDAAVARWRERVVRPLRDVRRELKTVGVPFAGDTAEHLRSEIKRSELAAEKIQQLTLEREFPAASIGVAADPLTAARANLDAYHPRQSALPAAAVETLLAVFAQQHGGAGKP